MATNPLEQFLIKSIVPLHIGGYDISFTNSSLFMVLTTALIILFQWVGVKDRKIIPSRIQSFYEISYDFIQTMVKDNLGEDGKKFFPFIFSLFLFILFGNLWGMIPYSFTFTSHIIVTGALAFIVFVLITSVGLAKHGVKFFRLFFPKGVPLAIAPILIPVEIIAYLFRPITLAIRLFANMMAGHMVLKLFGGFTVAMGVYGLFAPLPFLIFFTAFEVFVALLQAYVFTILTCIYLHDTLHLH
ncbi:MAG: F0F1 ATP synthase subunit A [Candidatus Paracaedimonas acanthamoebae]|uniref:ATP synthase subunit a n=1 Tax=Candidatus Paracaedimonas acanthamoebae TaxID=244581 RepID=A0A8J7TUX0_9PROT|nr:F0F1 ATP synthase subunit A [Candidatus Paracaedimonas acanthamoebae]